MVPDNVTVKELLLEIIRRVEEKIDDVQVRVEAQLTQHGATIEDLSNKVVKLINTVERYDTCITKTIPDHDKRLVKLERWRYKVAVWVGLAVTLLLVVGKTVLKRLFGLEF